jgi:hypothetical protein
MCRFTLSTAMLLLSLNVSAQVTSPLLNCVDSSKNNFQFTAIFNGQNATVVFKGWTYNLKYIGATVGPSGKRWLEYSNQEIRVATTFPFEKYVSIETWGSSHQIIAGAFCK